MIADIMSVVWMPEYSITPAIARGLMQIEAARALVDHMPISPAAKAELRAKPDCLQFITPPSLKETASQWPRQRQL